MELVCVVWPQQHGIWPVTLQPLCLCQYDTINMAVSPGREDSIERPGASYKRPTASVFHRRLITGCMCAFTCMCRQGGYNEAPLYYWCSSTATRLLLGGLAEAAVLTMSLCCLLAAQMYTVSTGGFLSRSKNELVINSLDQKEHWLIQKKSQQSSSIGPPVLLTYRLNSDEEKISSVQIE